MVSMIMALCILFSCILVQAQEMRTIAVDGSSTIKVAPNKATVSISITNSAKNSKEAANKNAAVMNKIQSALLGLTITEENRELTELDYMAIENAIINLQYGFLSEFAQDEVKKKYQRDLIHNILNGLLSS